MRKLVVVAWLAASSIFAGAPAAADGPVSLPPLAPGEVLLETTGVGVARTPATSARITANVSVQGSSEAEARRNAGTAVQRIVAAARAAGVAAGDIEAGEIDVSADPYGMGMNAISVDNVYNTAADPGGAEAAETHYASAAVTIRLRNAAGAAALKRTLDGLDHVSAGMPDYELDDDSTARRAARGEAMRRARADADTYAAAMNMRVARVLRVTERTGLAILALGFSENTTLMREMRRMESRNQDGQVPTYAIVGVDFALAPR